MIEIRDCGFNYNVRCTDKKQYNKFINYMVFNELTKKMDIGWKMPKELLSELEDLLGEVKLIANEWDYVGSDMKLTPYSYQKEAIHFAANREKTLLILPCGAGKTAILVGIYHELRRQNKTDKKGIIVVKASLKYQWLQEVKKFSNYKAKIINTPSKAKKKFDEQFEDADLFILNYETLKNNKVVEKLKEKDIDVMLLDEIHYINNFSTSKSKAACEFNYLSYIVGATATPITNNPENVFGIFNLLDKDLFKTHSKFASAYIKYAGYGRVAGVKNLDHLKKKIGPYMFIKTEEEVSDQLPSLVVNKCYCDIESPRMKEINDELFAELDTINEQIKNIESEYINKPKELESNEEYITAKSKVMAYQTFLQELVNDPRLLSDSESNMAKRYVCDDESPKLKLLLELVDDITSSGHKVCIFTKYARMQNLIKEELDKTFNFKTAIINGSMTSEERYEAAYTQFSDNEDYKVLIGTDAMAEGISLAKCNYLIEYDLADSYAIQTQRHGRIKRANSINKTSYVYEIICNGSWDEIQQKIISKKENYDIDIIKSIKD